MRHYYIYLDLHPSRGSVINLKSWVEYLLSVADGPVENIQALVMERKIAKAMKMGNQEDVILEEDHGEYD